MSDVSTTTSPPAFDFIGDIHGHADTLRHLLDKLGYEENAGTYHHPKGRQVVFLGDYIDRGPAIRETLQIVKAMVDAGNALAIMGNHEFNAICFHTPDGEGGHLRYHSDKNVEQHQATLDAFAEVEDEWDDWIEWFKCLPFYLDLDGARAVHATWDPASLKVLDNLALTDSASLIACSTENTNEFAAIEKVLKGTEIPLPEGTTFADKQGHKRSDIRVKWWGSPKGKTYREVVFPDSSEVPEVPIPPSDYNRWERYSDSAAPVFFGHYWVPASQEPAPQTHNTTCLDYSVSAESGGKLVAYRWDGEMTLIQEKFTSQHRLPA